MNIVVKVSGSKLSPHHEVVVDRQVLKGTKGVSLLADSKMSKVVVRCDETPEGKVSAGVVKSLSPALFLGQDVVKPPTTKKKIRKAILARGTTKLEEFSKKVKKALGIRLEIPETRKQAAPAPTVCSVYRNIQVRNKTTWLSKANFKAAAKKSPSSVRRV